MSEEQQELDINHLTEVVSDLQQEIRLIKNEIEKLKLTTLIDKLHLFIENTEEQFENLNTDIDRQKQELQQLKQSLTKSTPRRPSEYRQLQNMLQSARQTETITNSKNATNNMLPTRVEITSIQSNNRRTKR
ncbi:hypothetical protein [Gracilibacillus massiliensis]|uniref:hypothetical protein n=1 Tax=Gracilibacillus massiliensis TaxID=1564956 RepID=UPI00071D0742|nr:hypothetical protein [Gracilibacillus massiliensis]